MLKLRPYVPEDAETVLSWVKSDHEMRQWSADAFSQYPPEPGALNAFYEKWLPGGNIWPLMLTDDGRPAGHMFLRRTAPDTARFCFVIVDGARRGQRLGENMLRLGLSYASEELGFSNFTLGVFENNPSARACYRRAGFRETGEIKRFAVPGGEWPCAEMAYAAPEESAR